MGGAADLERTALLRRQRLGSGKRHGDGQRQSEQRRQREKSSFGRHGRSRDLLTVELLNSE
jgi:hypothetical protein